MAKIVLFGTGQGALTATRYLQKDTTHEVVAYTTDKAYIRASTFNGLPVLDFADVERYYAPGAYELFAPLGYDDMNRVRERVFREGKSKGYTFVSYVHSSIRTLEPLDIGENCFILENQSINQDVKIGNNVTMWSGNQVGDRCVIEDHVWISSHVCISGDVHIKSNSVLAVNCTITNNVVINEENFIGAGALITKSTSPKDVYLVPATPKAPLTSDRFIKMIKRS